MKKISIDSISFEIVQPDGDPFILAAVNPDSPSKYISWAINDFVIYASPNPDDKPLNKIRLWFIYTLPNFRRQGVASKLIKKLQEVHEEIETNVVSINGEGESLCLANGFKLIKPIHKNGLDKLIWKRGK